jgi:hypothetical protein
MIAKIIVLAAAALALAAEPAVAGEPVEPAAPCEPAPVKYDEPPPRDCPLAIACWARPLNTPAYDGYYVGGGATCRGDGPCPLEGTWGWDFIGRCYARKVMLGWWHGRRYQGGTGAYGINIPHLLPALGAAKQPCN